MKAYRKGLESLHVGHNITTNRMLVGWEKIIFIVQKKKNKREERYIHKIIFIVILMKKSRINYEKRKRNDYTFNISIRCESIVKIYNTMILVMELIISDI